MPATSAGRNAGRDGRGRSSGPRATRATPSRIDASFVGHASPSRGWARTARPRVRLADCTHRAHAGTGRRAAVATISGDVVADRPGPRENAVAQTSEDGASDSGDVRGQVARCTLEATSTRLRMASAFTADRYRVTSSNGADGDSGCELVGSGRPAPIRQLVETPSSAPSRAESLGRTEALPRRARRQSRDARRRREALTARFAWIADPSPPHRWNRPTIEDSTGRRSHGPRRDDAVDQLVDGLCPRRSRRGRSASCPEVATGSAARGEAQFPTPRRRARSRRPSRPRWCRGVRVRPTSAARSSMHAAIAGSRP